MNFSEKREQKSKQILEWFAQQEKTNAPKFNRVFGGSKATYFYWRNKYEESGGEVITASISVLDKKYIDTAQQKVNEWINRGKPLDSFNRVPIGILSHVELLKRKGLWNH